MKIMSMNRSWRFLLSIGILGILGPVIAMGQPQAGATLEGDARRGEAFFTTTYKCYACHGYQAETGNPRLNPMQMNQTSFLTFVQSGSPSGAMPAYGDAPPQDLADVFAYIRSLPSDAQPADSIPLLEAILDEIGDED